MSANREGTRGDRIPSAAEVVAAYAQERSSSPSASIYESLRGMQIQGVAPCSSVNLQQERLVWPSAREVAAGNSSNLDASRVVPRLIPSPMSTVARLSDPEASPIRSRDNTNNPSLEEQNGD